MNARRRALLLIAVSALAACGGQPASIEPGSDGQASQAANPAETQPLPTPAQGGSGESVASGTTIRVVNVWAEPDNPGPSVVLRLTGNEGAPPLVEVAPGEVSEFVSIPKAEFGDAAARVEVMPAGAPIQERGIGVGEVQLGDRITVIVHGEARDGEIAIRVEPVWEAGVPFYGLPWPEMSSSQATLAVYPGPLLVFPLGRISVAIRTTEGECLIETTFGEPQRSAFGGTGATFLFVDPGRTDLLVGSSPTPDCSPLEPDFGTVTIEARAGQRLGLIPWGQTNQIELLLLDFGAG